MIGTLKIAFLVFFLAPVFHLTAQTVVVADKTTRGRTADEKVYEYIVPANEWVVTNLLISPNQEVLVHHFNSNDRVTVKLGALTDLRLQKPGTILPLYTSRSCSTDPGIRAKVAYTCVQLDKAEGVKLFARNSVRVGVVVKNR